MYILCMLFAMSSSLTLNPDGGPITVVVDMNPFPSFMGYTREFANIFNTFMEHAYPGENIITLSQSSKNITHMIKINAQTSTDN